jgi:voltage-gated sodium channel
MYETMEVYPLSWLFYLTFIFLVAFIFLNMMIGIVIQTLQSEHEKIEKNPEIKAPEMIASENPITAPSIDARLARIEAHLESLSEAAGAKREGA